MAGGDMNIQVSRRQTMGVGQAQAAFDANSEQTDHFNNRVTGLGLKGDQEAYMSDDALKLFNSHVGSRGLTTKMVRFDEVDTSTFGGLFGTTMKSTISPDMEEQGLPK